ncbi:MAG: leucyl aminopeptidase [Patescibacteria group bacterium]|jgi:leucyl aminopeptidase
MQITVAKRPGTVGLALSLFLNEKPATHPLWKNLSPAARKCIADVIKKKGFSGAFGEIKIVEAGSGKIQQVLLLGLGKKSAYHHRRMARGMQLLIKTARDQKIHELSFAPTPMQIGDWEVERNTEALGVAVYMANYAFDLHKKAPAGGHHRVKKVEFVVEAEQSAEVRRGLASAKVIGEAMNEERDLANTPGGTMTPKLLVAAAKNMLAGLPVKMTVLGEKDMEKKGMGAVLSVGKGSREESQFLIMEYLPLKNERPLVFAGKGVTFDSGGLNLKPEQGITDMHHDMAGAGAVIAAIKSIAALKVQRNVVGLCPMVENMPGGSGYRPGDIITSLSGKTIEIANTDAEGRVILADALTFAKEYNPLFVVDVATLTGAVIVALGKRLIAGLSPNEGLALNIRTFSEPSGDYVWPLPLWEEFEDDIKGTFADVSNMGKVRGAGGVITAAMFLKQFAEGYEWLHLDIASTMVATEGQHLSPGATGTGVRFLVDIARRFEELAPYLKKA